MDVENDVRISGVSTASQAIASSRRADPTELVLPCRRIFMPFLRDARSPGLFHSSMPAMSSRSVGLAPGRSYRESKGRKVVSAGGNP